MSVNELARTFVDDVTDYAVVVIDGADKILLWNAGAQALLGYSAKETIGSSFLQLFSRLDPLALETGTMITEFARWGRHETNRELVRQDGTRFQANIVLRPIAGPQGQSGFGVILHDIDRSRRLAAAMPDLPSAVGAAPARGLARILVVDDNQGVLGIATDQLTSLGYSVVAASNGAEALGLLRQDDEIELLFTDVVMPGGMDGRVLAEKARALRPSLKVLFASGYYEDTLVGKGQLAADVRFLPKPYRRQELADKVAEALSGRR